jgi:hypothetical protein
MRTFAYLAIFLVACSSGGGSGGGGGGHIDFAMHHDGFVPFDMKHSDANTTGSCFDGIQNGAESDVDCGGPVCPRCADGQRCISNSDCSSSTCTGGVCGMNGCSPGTANCTGAGCTTNTDSDPSNCGACGHLCTLPHASSTCSSGQCAVSACGSGYSDCDFVASNGCETHTASDVNNCGSCGNPCGFGQICSNSFCQGGGGPDLSVVQDGGIKPLCSQGACAHSLCVASTALTSGCDGQSCVAAVCNADPFCCGSGGGTWDSSCVSEVATYCTCGC